MIWNPASTAPKDGTWLLVWDRGWSCPRVVRWVHSAGRFEFPDDPDETPDILWWHPITTPEGIE